MKSSPFPTTPSIARRRRQHFQTQRGGKRRFGSHKRGMTRVMNPRLPHHYAYICALKVAGRKADIKSVKVLRKKVSQMVKALYEDEGKVHGIDIRRMIDMTYGDVESYVEHVAKDQWASLVELHCASVIENVSFYVKSRHGVVKMGEQASKSIVSLKNNHYILMKMHKNVGDKKLDEEKSWVEEQVSDETIPAWAWSHMVTDAGMTRGENVHVRIGRTVRTDVISVSFRLPQEAKVSALKTRLVDMIGLPRTRLTISKRNEHKTELYDWSDIPEHVVVDDNLALPENLMMITLQCSSHLSRRRSSFLCQMVRQTSRSA